MPSKYDIICKSLHKRSASIYSGMKARAKKELTELPFSLDDFREWLDHKFTQDGTARCEYSGEMVLIENFSVDHRDPIARNGSWDLRNMAVCSKKQNLRKGIMTYQEFRALTMYIGCNFLPDVQTSIWRRLEVGDVQRFSHYRRLKKGRVTP